MRRLWLGDVTPALAYAVAAGGAWGRGFAGMKGVGRLELGLRLGGAECGLNAGCRF